LVLGRKLKKEESKKELTIEEEKIKKKRLRWGTERKKKQKKKEKKKLLIGGNIRIKSRRIRRRQYGREGIQRNRVDRIRTRNMSLNMHRVIKGRVKNNRRLILARRTKVIGRRN
jgi:hypothetical protein